MNISLTLECNNHCPYCFQKNIRDNNSIMELENVKKIIDWSYYKDLDIKFLGGEPTLYPYFKEAIDYTLQKCNDNFCCVMTNLLGPDNNIEVLCDGLQKYKKFNLLVNTTYDKNKKQTFIKNLKKVYDVAPDKSNITLGLTLMPNEQINKNNILNLSSLIMMFPKIVIVRIGLETPIIGENYTNTYSYEKDLDMLFSYLGKQKVLFDCGINFCQISREYFEKKLMFNKKIEIISTQCPGACVDILPDLSGKYCFCSDGKEFFIDNIFKYNSYIELERDMNLKQINYIVKNKRCNQCDLFKQGICTPCHSCDQAWLKVENNQ